MFLVIWDMKEIMCFLYVYKINFQGELILKQVYKQIYFKVFWLYKNCKEYHFPRCDRYFPLSFSIIEINFVF